MAQHTIDLPCIADTWLDQANPNTNYGTATILKGGYMDSPGNQILLRFNNSSYPSGKKFISSKLRVYNLIARSASSGDINCETHTSTWLENTATWSNNYNGTNHKYSGYASLSANQYVELDISDIYFRKSDISSILNLAIYWFGYGMSSGSNYMQISSRETANSPILRIVYEDVPPGIPTPLSPIGINIANTNIIRFNWQYNSLAGGTQKAFDLQWSIDGVVWTTISQTSSNTYYDMPANTFPSSKNIYWRVQTYNEYNEASNYCDTSAFYSVGIPATPTITSISNTARPTVSWNSTGQQVYQVQILLGSTVVYDSGEIASDSIKLHKVETFLPDGNYLARVRIKNEFGLVSEWGSSAFNITTLKPNKPTLTLSASKYSITVNLSNTGNSAYFLIYRSISSGNYICICKITGNTYIDYTVESGKQYSYYVHAVSEIETFTDSDVKTITTPIFRNTIIAPVSNLSNMFEVKYNLNDRIGKNIAFNLLNSTNYYCGRKYPVVEFSEHSSYSINLSFFIKEESEYIKLIDIINLKGTVLYKDSRRKLYGNINGISEINHYDGYIINLSINRIDYNEEVEV